MIYVVWVGGIVDTMKLGDDMRVSMWESRTTMKLCCLLALYIINAFHLFGEAFRYINELSYFEIHFISMFVDIAVISSSYHPHAKMYLAPAFIVRLLSYLLVAELVVDAFALVRVGGDDEYASKSANRITKLVLMSAVALFDLGKVLSLSTSYIRHADETVVDSGENVPVIVGGHVYCKACESEDRTGMSHTNHASHCTRST